MARVERVSVSGLIVWLIVVVGIGGGTIWLIRRGLTEGNSALVLVGLLIVLAIGRFVYKGIRFARSMESFAGVNESNAQGYFPLHVAAGQGDRDQVSLLLANGAEVDAEHTMLGFTPLHLAALEQHVDVCRILIAAGADPHAFAADGRTPMDVAQDIKNETLMDIMGCE